MEGEFIKREIKSQLQENKIKHEDSLPRNIACVEQQTATNENIAPAFPSVEGGASYPTRTHKKPSYLSEYVVESITDNTTNVTTDYCYGMNDIPACYSQAVHSPDLARWKRHWMKNLTL